MPGWTKPVYTHALVEAHACGCRSMIDEYPSLERGDADCKRYSRRSRQLEADRPEEGARPHYFVKRYDPEQTTEPEYAKRFENACEKHFTYR